MSKPAQPEVEKAASLETTTVSRSEWLHRVCIQCNNVFQVPADKFDAKQCPKCHKG